MGLEGLRALFEATAARLTFDENTQAVAVGGPAEGKALRAFSRALGTVPISRRLTDHCAPLADRAGWWWSNGAKPTHPGRGLAPAAAALGKR